VTRTWAAVGVVSAVVAFAIEWLSPMDSGNPLARALLIALGTFLAWVVVPLVVATILRFRRRE